MKNLLSLVLLAGAGIYYFGKNKVDQVNDVFSNLKVSIKSIEKLSLSGSALNFLTTLNLNNATSDSLSFNTLGQATLKKIKFYTKSKKYIGEATPNLEKFTINGNGNTIIPNIPTRVPITNIGDLFSNAYEVFQNPNDLFIQIELEALGRTIILEA